MSLIDYTTSGATHYHYGKFPPSELDYKLIAAPLARAAAAIGRYDAVMQSLHNSELLLAPLRNREAVISSRMEGTVATLDEILEFEAEDDDQEFSKYRKDVIEVVSYTRALNFAQNLITSGLPISGRLIKDAHQKLLSFGRGAKLQPGEFKSDQNYIVDKNKKQILFIPADPQRFPDLFHTLEIYINDTSNEALLATALTHVEFESLHPFKDGNGRVGRMLITLMLWTRGLISAPHFYISGQLEQSKDEYIDRMRAVSEKGDWTGWCVFFLNALTDQAEENIETANKIQALYTEMKGKFQHTLSSQYSIAALDFVFQKPIFRNSTFLSESGIPKQSAHRITSALSEAKYLTVIRPAAGRRSAFYAFEPLLQIVRQ